MQCLLMAANALAVYPDHHKQFNVYTDASDFQLGACIIQEWRPVAYFLQKLTKSQQKLYNNRKRNAFNHCNSWRISRYAPQCGHSCFLRIIKTWRLILSKCNMYYTGIQKLKCFLPILHYIEGPCNILADNFSRLHRLVTPAQIAEGEKLVEPAEASNEEEDKAYSSIRILWSLRWERLGMYWVLSQLTWHSTSGWESVELSTHLWIAITGQTSACSTSVS